MGVFGFLKRKKKAELELPPPPEGLAIPPLPEGLKAPVREEGVKHPISELPEIKPEKEIGYMKPEELPAPRPIPMEEELEIPFPVKKIPQVKEKPQPKRILERAPEEKEEPEIKVARMPTRPVFVSLRDYEAIIESADRLKERVKETEEIMDSMANLRMQEEKQLGSWRNILEDAERKLAYADQVISRGEE